MDHVYVLNSYSVLFTGVMVYVSTLTRARAYALQYGPERGSIENQKSWVLLRGFHKQQQITGTFILIGNLFY